MNPKRLVDVVPVLIAGWIALLIGQTFAMRMGYPYDLEWMEGGMVAHAWRVQQGLPLYIEPDASWIPYIYPPGYPAAVAGAGMLTEVSAPTGRAVSVLGTVLACAALVFGVRRQTGGMVGGVLAVGLFLSCYPDSGGFYDLVRPDALAIGLTGWALVLAMESSRSVRVAAALLLASAFCVKHNTAAFGVPLALGVWAQRGWKEALVFGLSSAIPAGLFTLGMQWSTGGHFLTTLIDVPGAHPMVQARFVPGAVEELSRHLGLAMAAVSGLFLTFTARLTPNRWWVVVGAATIGAALALALGLPLETPRGTMAPVWYREWAGWASIGGCAGGTLAGLGLAVASRRLDGRWVFATGISATALIVAGIMRAHHGGFLNVYIPVHWVVALSGGVGLELARRVWPSGVTYLVTAVVFGGQLYLKADIDPVRFSPTAEDVAAGDRFVEVLRECDGPVLSPFAPWLPALAGHEPSFHLIALWDINHRDGPYRDSVRQIAEAADAQAWACVVDGGNRQALRHRIPKNYVRRVTPPAPPIRGRKGPPTFMPRTGWRARPTNVLFPRERPVQ